MPVKPEFNPDFLYFVTTAAIQHISLFRDEAAIRVILESLAFFRARKRVNLYAFVLMPNHVHFIARFTKDYVLSDGLRDFKRHTARKILDNLSSSARASLLSQLHRLNQDSRQDYKVWADGYDAREIYSPGFLQQKVSYVHHNPCQMHWRLAEKPEDYPWSTARYYLLDQPAVIPIDDVRDLFV